MTVTLDDVSCLLHLPIDGMLLSHETITWDDAVDSMVTHLGSDPGDALLEVTRTRDLDVVASFSWGDAALAHLYRELNNATHWNCGQVSGYLTLLQAWVYQHFRGMGSKDAWVGYRRIRIYA
uniref:Aminotransferase-like plant mobile domain-containing protein n=1 Tax=Medicago truncatula TaxID=3880 RepID=Q1RU80_MEDTR|nr:hypothetical protein MtrDRAFT_AC153123g9v2 [Medicago truncatula]